MRNEVFIAWDYETSEFVLIDRDAVLIFSFYM